MSDLTDEELLAILKEIDPATQRLPSGFRDFAHAIIWTLKARAVIAAWNTRTNPAIPFGWKLVPIEPTQSMMIAYDNAHHRAYFSDLGYAAMLDAAPAPENKNG